MMSLTGHLELIPLPRERIRAGAVLGKDSARSRMNPFAQKQQHIKISIKLQ